MSTTSPRVARARLAALKRWDPANADAHARAARDLAEANIRAAIERAVATAPPLSDEQRMRLTALLTGKAATAA